MKIANFDLKAQVLSTLNWTAVNQYIMLML